MQALRTIPLVDLRDGGSELHARLHREDALALRRACLGVVPGLGALAAPAADALARRWLERSDSPYAEETARVARAVGRPGVFVINTSYEWGCTTRAAPGPSGLPRLRRTLDWPFAGLGRHVHVARQRGPAGEFLNVTWPGAVGVLTAVAPGRFAATINQAPLRRDRPGAGVASLAADIGGQALRTWRDVRHMPASHLLRLAFETAPGYAAAREALATVPVARPVLFTLAGVAPGEACLIERWEGGARVHDGTVTVANDWLEPREGWRPRGLGADPAADNRARTACLAAQDGTGGLAWAVPPVRCPCTRLAVEACAATGSLLVGGFEPGPGPGGVVEATRPFALAGGMA